MDTKGRRPYGEPAAANQASSRTALGRTTRVICPNPNEKPSRIYPTSIREEEAS